MRPFAPALQTTASHCLARYREVHFHFADRFGVNSSEVGVTLWEAADRKGREGLGRAKGWVGAAKAT